MNDVLLMASIIVVLAAMIGLFVWLRRRPRRMKPRYFQTKWRDLQKLCASKDSWAQAIMEADKLLDEALKKKRFAGKTMGERLTGAQRLLTNNEAVWFGHKLRNKLHEDPSTKLKEKDVKEALIGIRQALKDLGALPMGKTEQATPVPDARVAKPRKGTKAAKVTEAAPAATARPKAPARRSASKAATPAPRPARRKVVQ